MPVIRLQTEIKAPKDVVFNLSRSVDAHLASAAQTTERAVAGKTSGLLEKGDTVTWEAVHFGLKQKLSVAITEMDYPNSFTDEMLKGAFKSMKHEHYFEHTDGITIMQDVFNYESPLGILGKVADVLFLKRYMRNFLKKRNAVIKQMAEHHMQLHK